MNRAKWVLAVSGCIGTGCVLAAEPSIDLRDAWKGRTDVLAQAALPGAGFSFWYQGKIIGPELSTEWRQTVSHDDRTGLTKTAFTHPSGLVVTREVRTFPTFGAIEYQVSFKNTSAKRLAPVSHIHSLDLSLGNPIVNGSCVISSGGGMADGFLPPRTFALRRNCFAPTVPDDGLIELTTDGGRSSNRDLPFFFIQNNAQQAGMFVAFGWSGQWDALVLRDPKAGTLRLWGEIPDVEIALEPGEKIEGPTVLLGVYQGQLADGSNELRRLIRHEYTPRLEGKSFIPAATYDIWDLEDSFDETLLKKLADGAAAVGQEYFLLDAGWFRGNSWWESTGNWNQVSTSKLPNGLKPVADYVRSKGLKFGLWFEPERVVRGTQLAKAHSDWILWKHDRAPSWHETQPSWPEDLPEEQTDMGLLDYGRPEVQRWVREMMDRYISAYDIRYIRYDFNINPLPYWNAYDKPNRRGMTQLRYVEGLYSVLDWIREHHPSTVLEGCAGGGRRIDLETARRFHTFWISDYTVDPSIVRFHLFGINEFLPGNYHYIQYTLPAPNQKEYQADDLGFQSLFGGAFGTGGRVDLWPEDVKRKALVHVEIWKKLRRYLVEDYYPLSDQPGDLTSWSGWQFQDPKDTSGFVQTFRTNTPEVTHRFVIHNLDAQARYRFTDVYSNRTFDVDGTTATTQGIEVSQDPMSSQILTFRRLTQ